MTGNCGLASYFNEVNTTKRSQFAVSGDCNEEECLLIGSDVISPNYTTDDGSGGHHLIDAGIFHLSAVKRYFIFLLTPVWAIVLALAVERMATVLHNLFCLRHYRLYGWLPVNEWYETGGLWMISWCWNSYLLECGSHHGDELPGKCCGVHILQMLSWGHLSCVFLCCLAASFRQRSELKPKFPYRVRKVGAVRYASGRLTRTWRYRRSVVTLILLMNIATAEAVRVGQEVSRNESFHALHHEYTSEQCPECNVLSTSCARPLPTGKSRCQDDVREGQADIKFCGDTLTNLDIANEFNDVLQGSFLLQMDTILSVERCIPVLFQILCNLQTQVMGLLLLETKRLR